MAGVDAFQSLVIAVLMIGAEVYASRYRKSGTLRWYEPDQGCGFPVGSNLRELLIGDEVFLSVARANDV